MGIVDDSAGADNGDSVVQAARHFGFVVEMGKNFGLVQSFFQNAPIRNWFKDTQLISRAIRYIINCATGREGQKNLFTLVANGLSSVLCVRRALFSSLKLICPRFSIAHLDSGVRQ
jgi:hypothetical protein